MKLTIFVVLLTVCTQLFASNIDLELKNYINRFKLTPLTKIIDKKPRLTNLGELLFRDNILSRNENISCLTCHHPALGTSDSLPLSIGEGGQGIGLLRVQSQGHITRRHANHIFNKGFPELTHMFWDGRVSVDSNGILSTPEAALNGATPKAKEIANLLKTPLEAQAIFPISSEAEMFGANNEGFNNLEKWELIAKKVYSNTYYKKEFDKIFKLRAGEFNIGHIAKALAQFQKIRFQVTETNWDKYLRGDLKALSLSQKKGAKIFMTKARCTHCHNRSHLGGQSFQNSAAPQLIFKSDKKDDLGRFEVTGVESHKYRFKVPPLRNIAKTAPYFHTGVFLTLEQVVEHYNDPYQSLRNFSSELTINNYSMNYDQKFINMSSFQVEQRLKRLPMFYRHHGPLGLSDREKVELVDFLRNGLSQ